MKKKEIIVQFISENKGLSAKECFIKYITKNPGAVSQIYFTNVFNFNAVSSILSNKVKEEVIENSKNEGSKNLLTNINDINTQFNDSILIPIKGDIILDNVISLKGGIMPATVTVVPGESGVGKTTLLLAYFEKIAKTNPDIRLLYVSSEMNAIHVYKYSKRIDMSKVNIMLLSESESPKEDFEEILKVGWDVVILDSLADTISKVRLASDWTEKATESWVLKYMDSIRRGNNDLKKYTAFFCTQHMTKGKEYAGSTNLKHMTDAMMNLLTDEKSPTETYIEYTKNRDGKKNVRLYFYIDDKGLQFNEERFKRDNEIRIKIDNTREIMNTNSNKFEEFFLSNESLENANTASEENNETMQIISPIESFEAVEVIA